MIFCKEKILRLIIIISERQNSLSIWISNGGAGRAKWAISQARSGFSKAKRLSILARPTVCQENYPRWSKYEFSRLEVRRFQTLCGMSSRSRSSCIASPGQVLRSLQAAQLGLQVHDIHKNTCWTCTLQKCKCSAEQLAMIPDPNKKKRKLAKHRWFLDGLIEWWFFKWLV